MNKQEDIRGFKLANTYFLLHGIVILISWNAVLTGLDFFRDCYPDGSVDFTFPVANLLPLPFCSLLLVYIEKKLSLHFRVFGCTVLMGISTLVLPIISIILPNSLFGLWLNYISLVFLGIVNSIAQAGVVGLAGYFPPECMARFATGNGIAGLILNGLRALCLLYFPDTKLGNFIGVIIYYGAVGIMMAICLIWYYRFINSDYASKRIIAQKNQSVDDYQNITNDPSIETGDQISLNSKTIEKEGSIQGDMWKDLKYMFHVSKEIAIYPILMFVMYLQTFTLFPGVMLMRNTPTISESWKTIIMMTIFNAFDTLGRILSNYRARYNKTIVSIIVILRFVFFFTFIVQVVKPQMFLVNTLGFCFLNISIFGLTNGFVNGATFILAPEVVEGYKKEVAGFIMVLSLNFSMMLGSVLALPFENLSH